MHLPVQILKHIKVRWILISCQYLCSSAGGKKGILKMICVIYHCGVELKYFIQTHIIQEPVFHNINSYNINNNQNINDLEG